MGGFAWVTLATNDSYSLGALVLAHSLKQAGTQQQLAVLITPGVTAPMREKLASVFNLVQEVNILDSKDESNLRLLKRPELGITFTKLHCWRLTQFDKCVFLDADTLVLSNCDELFDREELSAAPDVGWPDCFNSGVFVYRPSNETYEKLIQFALEKGSFDGGDQGLLNLYFSDWAHKDISKHLPFIYNLCSTACYSYLPAFKQYGGNAKIIHFIGATKPWLQYFDTETRKVNPSGDSNHLQGVLQRWWDIFCSLIHPELSPEMAGLAGAFAQLTLGAPRTAEQNALEDHLRRQGWEVGNIDYLGRDSFENIWSKICQTISTAPPATEAKPKDPTPPPAPVVSEVKPAETPAEVEKPKPEEPKPEQVEAPKPCELPPKPAPPTEAPAEQCPIPPKPSPEPEVCPLETKPATPTECPLAPKEPPSPQTAAPQTPTECPKVPSAPATECKLPSGPPTPQTPTECPKVPSAPATECKLPSGPPTPQTPTECPKLPSGPATPQTPTESSKLPSGPPTPVESPKTPPVEAAKPAVPPAEAPKSAPEAPKTAAPQTPTQAVQPAPTTPEPVKPAPEAPKPKEAPKTPAEAPKTPTEAPKTPTEAPKTPTEAPKTPTDAPAPKSPAAAPKAEVTEATPPTTPVSPSPKQSKQVAAALAVETSVPDTPPPAAEAPAAAAAASTGVPTPTPPPRKGSGGGKKSGKSKK